MFVLKQQCLCRTTGINTQKISEAKCSTTQTDPAGRIWTYYIYFIGLLWHWKYGCMLIQCTKTQSNRWTNILWFKVSDTRQTEPTVTTGTRGQGSEFPNGHNVTLCSCYDNTAGSVDSAEVPGTNSAPSRQEPHPARITLVFPVVKLASVLGCWCWMHTLNQLCSLGVWWGV